MFQKAALSIFCFLMTGYYTIAGNNDSTTEIHRLTELNKLCKDCHKKTDIHVTVDNPPDACAFLCISCHGEIGNHHSINIKMNEKLPDSINLTSKKRLTCRTCHNITLKRYGDKSWKAESMFEKIFKSKDKYKTYFLIKNNSNGQLCKTCH
ncbi:MAG: hypothetical protein JW864_15515 [Spirochaetes bacterium]|nr:hypothetical protein [Spirochaetota bacterium]